MPDRHFFHAALSWKRPFDCPVAENAPLSRVLNPFPFQFFSTFLGRKFFHGYFFAIRSLHGSQDVRSYQQMQLPWGLQNRRCLFSTQPCLVSLILRSRFQFLSLFLRLLHKLYDRSVCWRWVFCVLPYSCSFRLFRNRIHTYFNRYSDFLFYFAASVVISAS